MPAFRSSTKWGQVRSAIAQRPWLCRKSRELVARDCLRWFWVFEVKPMLWPSPIILLDCGLTWNTRLAERKSRDSRSWIIRSPQSPRKARQPHYQLSYLIISNIFDIISKTQLCFRLGISDRSASAPPPGLKRNNAQGTGEPRAAELSGWWPMICSECCTIFQDSLSLSQFNASNFIGSLNLLFRGIIRIAFQAAFILFSSIL